MFGPAPPTVVLKLFHSCLFKKDNDEESTRIEFFVRKQQWDSLEGKLLANNVVVILFVKHDITDININCILFPFIIY